MVENLAEVVQEIHKLRDDMRADVKELHDKVERFHDKTDKKIENQRDCIVEKIDKQRVESSQKVGSTWFRWITGFIVLGMLTIGGLASSNKAEISEVKTTVENSIESQTKQMKEIRSLLEQHMENENADTESGGE